MDLIEATDKKIEPRAVRLIVQLHEEKIRKLDEEITALAVLGVLLQSVASFMSPFVCNIILIFLARRNSVCSRGLFAIAIVVIMLTWML